MKIKSMNHLKRMIAVLLGSAAFLMGAGIVTAKGLTAAQLEAAGYTCFSAGPSGWIHCPNPQLFSRGARAVPVMVFTEDGNVFLGTEQLLRNDTYAQQPCPQDAIATWEVVEGTPYYACHHFFTGHHSE